MIITSENFDYLGMNLNNRFYERVNENQEEELRQLKENLEWIRKDDERRRWFEKSTLERSSSQ